MTTVLYTSTPARPLACAVPPHTALTMHVSTLPTHPRSAPLPLKVDGFSMGAVMGYSEQKSVVVLGSEEEAGIFLKVCGDV